MRRNEKVSDDRSSFCHTTNHFYEYSKLHKKKLNYICECVEFINKLSLKSKLYIEIIIIPNSKINIKTYYEGLDPFKKFSVIYILDSYFNTNKSNIFNLLIKNEYQSEELKLNEEILLEENKDYMKSDYIEMKIIEMKAIDLYYSGYHIADIYKRSAIEKQVNRYYNEKINEININWGNIGDIGVEYLCDFMCSMRNLHTINLFINNISDKGLYYICNCLKYLHEIRNINLGGNRISDNGLIEFSNNFVHITKLQSLGLMKNQIEDTGIIYMCKYLSYLKNLKVLSIKHNHITNHGYRLLCDEIVKFPQLTIA